MSERFVKLLISTGGPNQYPAWGIVDVRQNFMLIYTDSQEAEDECDNAPLRLISDEVDSIEEATERNTPDEAWVALAKYRLAPEIFENGGDA